MDANANILVYEIIYWAFGGYDPLNWVVVDPYSTFWMHAITSDGEYTENDGIPGCTRETTADGET